MSTWEGCCPRSSPSRVAKAVGFRNILVPECIEVDDDQVVHLGDLERFVAEVRLAGGSGLMLGPDRCSAA